ncbi:hypothetical protein RUND412_010046, partial [Rhizina undulata]
IPDNNKALWNFNFKNAKELQPLREIFKEFKDNPLEDYIHIIIKTSTPPPPPLPPPPTS